jgi:glycosyltransferase involved in cell wall biosynthesis
VEVIVIDDGSTDDTRNVVEPFKDRVLYHYQPNGGLAAARNAGAALAQGNFVAWLDADDLCAKDRFLVEAAYLTANPEVVAIGSNFSAFDDEIGTFDVAHAARYYFQIRKTGLAGLFPSVADFDGRGVPWLSTPFDKIVRVYSGRVWHKIIVGNFMHPPTLMMRKEARERNGWQRLGCKNGSDWEYIIGLAKLGPLAFVDEALLEYRRHSAQMSSTIGELNSAQENIELMQRLLDDPAAIADENVHRSVREKLGDLHLSAARILAESEPRRAIDHLRVAWKSPAARRHIPRHLARIAMPQVGYRLIRLLRRRLLRRQFDGLGRPL